MALDYLLLKKIHLHCVGLSVALFALRLGLRLAAPERLAAWKVLRVLPHGVDTLLLLTAIAMVVVGGIDLLRSPWLLAKIGALLVYIGLGTVALKRGRTRGIRLAAWLAALVALSYIVSVAMTKQVWPL